MKTRDALLAVLIFCGVVFVVSAFAGIFDPSAKKANPAPAPAPPRLTFHVEQPLPFSVLTVHDEATGREFLVVIPPSGGAVAVIELSPVPNSTPVPAGEPKA